MPRLVTRSPRLPLPLVSEYIMFSIYVFLLIVNSPAPIPAKRGPDFYANPPDRQMVTQFPVHSVSDFKTLVERGCYYADRTKYIKQIEEDADVLTFFRPKRFGKSLFLSTLKHFYDIKGADDFKRLFGPFEIFSHASNMKHSQFLIFELDFSTGAR